MDTGPTTPGLPPLPAQDQSTPGIDTIKQNDPSVTFSPPPPEPPAINLDAYRRQDHTAMYVMMALLVAVVAAGGVTYYLIKERNLDVQATYNRLPLPKFGFGSGGVEKQAPAGTDTEGGAEAPMEDPEGTTTK
jgi:hypothetical protein